MYVLALRGQTPATRKNAAEAHKSRLKELRKDNSRKLIVNLFYCYIQQEPCDMLCFLRFLSNLGYVFLAFVAFFYLLTFN